MSRARIPACLVVQSPTEDQPALVTCRQCGASDRLPQNVLIESFLGFIRGFNSAHRDCERAWKKAHKPEGATR